MAKYVTEKTLKNVRSGQTIYAVNEALCMIFAIRNKGERRLIIRKLPEGAKRKVDAQMYFKYSMPISADGTCFWRLKDAAAALAKHMEVRYG